MPSTRTAWRWVPSLYFAEGLPYVVVMSVAGIMYKRLGVSNTELALSTSWLYLPWVIKPLWSPLVEGLGARRRWIVATQLLIGAGLGATALAVVSDQMLAYTVAGLAFLAMSSATHDVAADGFYMMALDDHQQAWFVGVRNTAYRIAMIAGQGLLVMLAGWLEVRLDNPSLAWSGVFYLAAGFFLLLGLYHAVALPRPAADQATMAEDHLLSGYWSAMAAFFRKPGIAAVLAFLFFYRFAEAQLVKISGPFLLDTRETGGLALTTSEVGFLYGVYGVLMLLAGGLLGGFAAARDGLRYWIWWMVAAINLPNAVYLLLAAWQPESYWIVGTAVAFEQFGYGFGFTAFMVYCLYAARGEHQTVHYSLCTGGMALGMMVPGMWSGWLADVLGYQGFFAWIMLATLPSFLVVAIIPLDAEFGKKRDD